MYSNPLSLHGYLGNFGDVRVVGVVRCKSEKMTRGNPHGLHPLASNLDDIVQARPFSGVPETQLDRVQATSLREFIDHHFRGKGGV